MQMDIPLIFDYGNTYALDKLEYYPRDNYGNGTVKQLDVYTSLDGVHWTLQHEGASDEWTYDTGKSVAENVKTVDLSGIGARYVKMIVKSSKGNFFASNEIVVYKADGTKAFAVGSTNGLAAVAEADYTNMKNYLGFSEKDVTTFVQQIKSRFGDINGNDVYDVYDYAFTMFKLDGGTSKNGAVSGKLLLLPSAERVNAGDTFTIAVYADDVKNLNALGEVLDYDPAKLQYVSTTADLDIAQMEDLTVNKVYEDQTAYVNLAFANRGNQRLYSGTGVIATITMQAKENVNVVDAIDLSKIMMIGSKFDTVGCESLENPKIPEITTGGGEYTYNTDFTMTITNDSLTTDDGSNVEKLVQQKNFDGLFDGQYSRDFEFKWDLESNYTEREFPEYVTVPVTLHLNMTEAKAVDAVKVYNSNKGNGYVTKAEAVFYYEDSTSGSVAEITADNSDYFAFTFNNQNADKAVTSVDVIINSTTGTTAAGKSNQMLTLSEMKLRYASVNVPVTGIAAAEENVKEMCAGSLVDVNAVITPENATNPYVTILMKAGVPLQKH